MKCLTGSAKIVASIIKDSGCEIHLDLIEKMLASGLYHILLLNGVVFLFAPVTTSLCIGHVYSPPDKRGSAAIHGLKAALKWVVDNTGYAAIIGFVRNEDRNIKLFLRLSGMEEKASITAPGLSMYVYPKEV